jgi:hypothetical protein
MSFSLEADDIYVESCAYHEAGHIVIAAVQNMPLRQRGIRNDQVGNGYSMPCRLTKLPSENAATLLLSGSLSAPRPALLHRPVALRARCQNAATIAVA